MQKTNQEKNQIKLCKILRLLQFQSQVFHKTISNLAREPQLLLIIKLVHRLIYKKHLCCIQQKSALHQYLISLLNLDNGLFHLIRYDFFSSQNKFINHFSRINIFGRNQSKQLFINNLQKEFTVRLSVVITTHIIIMFTAPTTLLVFLFHTWI